MGNRLAYKPNDVIRTGCKPCPLCGKILKWLPIRNIVFGEWGRSWFGEPYTSAGVEPHEFYTWIDHNFPMGNDEIMLRADDGMFGMTGGIPINRKLYMELQDDPDIDYKDLGRGYLEHTDCEPKERFSISEMQDAIVYLGKGLYD